MQNLKSLLHLFRFCAHHTAGSGRDGIPRAGQQEVFHQKFLHQPSEKGMEAFINCSRKVDRYRNKTGDSAFYTILV